jgi:hypothetical protein
MKIAVMILALASILAASATAQAQNNAGRFFARKPGIPAKPGVAPAQKHASTEDADGDVPEEPAEPSDPEIVKLFLMDGSVITGKLSVKEIVVETQFGQLTVPVTELRSFTPGLVSHPELAKQIYDLIESLGSDQFEQREKAQKILVKMGKPVRGELEKRIRDPDTERRTRIKAVLDELDEQGDDEDDDGKAATSPVLISRDQVETTEFSIVGRIATNTLTVSSLYGPLTVKLGDVRRGQRDDVRRADMHKSVEIDGSFIVQRSMKETKIRLQRGDRVTVTAEGSIVMTPWGNGASCGPDGAGNYGWYMPNSIPNGALVAVVGSGDNVFKIGSKASFRAERSGNLRLGIGMQPNFAGQDFPGRYTVKIRVERR